MRDIGDVPGFCLLMAMAWAQKQEDLQCSEQPMLWRKLAAVFGTPGPL